MKPHPLIAESVLRLRVSLSLGRLRIAVASHQHRINVVMTAVFESRVQYPMEESIKLTEQTDN